MSVPSFAFLGCALVGALVFNLAGKGIVSRLVMLALNLAFFATFLRWSPGWDTWAETLLSAAPYGGFLLFGYLGMLALRANQSRVLQIVCIIVAIAAFLWLRRYVFVPQSLALSNLYVTIGIGYVFFRVLHLIIDAGQGALKENISPLSYLNYTLNFPALVSGPIQLYPDFKGAEAERPPLNFAALAGATERIVAGLFKVMIVSALLSTWQNTVLALLPGETDPFTRVGLVAASGAIYPLFLYANFSGYTDFVIGVARLFRLKLPENFNNPFGAESFIDFWSRWHITLSSWMKAYVCTPLLSALSARDKRKEHWYAVAALFVTFFLVGAWHGQTTEFLFFGVLQGAGVATNKLWQIAMQRRLHTKGYRALGANPLYRALSRGLTFTYFAFTLMWFWSSWIGIGDLAYAEGLSGFILAWGVVFVSATMLLSALVWMQERLAKAKLFGDPVLTSRYVRFAWTMAMAACVLVAAYLTTSPPEILGNL